MCLGRWILLTAVLVSLPRLSFAQTSDWAVSGQLLPGQKVKVITADGKSHVGYVGSVSDDAIRLGKNQSLQKVDVQQLLLWSPGHHRRNVLIGLGIGAGVGLGAGLRSGSQLPEGDRLDSTAQEVAIAVPLCAGIGAGIGALIPARGAWHEVYRSK